MAKNSSTDLDALYDLLQEKKELRIKDISEKFNVNEELVMNWGKILEAGNLAIINNPRIGKPSIIIIEKENEIKKEGKKTKVEKPKLKKQEKKTIEKANKSIKEENKKKIKGAKDLIRQLKEMGHKDEDIKKLFTEKGWPDDLIAHLLKNM